MFAGRLVQNILTFLGLLLPITLSPGPATVALAGTGMANGFVKSMPFFFGLFFAALLIIVAGGFGLNELFLSSPAVYPVLRYAGIAYIFYLAWKLFRARPEIGEGSTVNYRFLDGMLLTVLNPKFYVLVTVFYSQFLKPGESGLVWMIAGLSLVMIFSQTVWLGIGAGLRPLLKSTRALRIQTTIFGILLALVAVYLLVKDGL
jgi:threonine/homoserine/homoserine lactone efflux protein